MADQEFFLLCLTESLNAFNTSMHCHKIITRLYYNMHTVQWISVVAAPSVALELLQKVIKPQIKNHNLFQFRRSTQTVRQNYAFKTTDPVFDKHVTGNNTIFFCLKDQTLTQIHYIAG